MPKYNFGSTQDSTLYWGRVVKSYVGPPSEAYVKAGGRGDQWHIEVEPLYPFVYEKSADRDGLRKRGQNLPMPGQAPKTGSPIMERITAYRNCGIDIQSDEDFKKLEGHIFYFSGEMRKGKTGNREWEKNDDWPMAMNDEFVPPDEPVLIKNEDSGSSGGGSAAPTSMSPEDVFSTAAGILNGKAITPGIELTFILGAGKPQLQQNTELMTAMQQNKLHKLLVEKDFGTFDEKTKVFTANPDKVKA